MLNCYVFVVRFYKKGNVFMKKLLLISLLTIVVLFYLTGCSGIQLVNNCKKNVSETITVLPFVGDEYSCNENIEQLLSSMCYNVVDGRTLVNEICLATGKTLADISLDEFSKFASNKGVHKIVYGTINIVWIEAPGIFKEANEGRLKKDNNENSNDAIIGLDKIIEGNYASLDCFCLDVRTGKTDKILGNYKVKKISLGAPNVLEKELAN